MKRIITAFLLSGISSALIANEKDTVRFVYVLQNPKFYGIDKARSWFELEGMNDKTIQYSINDGLKASYLELTNLEDGTQNATSRPDKETPAGYTDYYYWNGQTYGNGWVRFKDSDSLLRLTSADGYYGSGAGIGGFSQEILEGKLAWIGIHTTRFSNEEMEYDRTIDLAFDLRTGKVIPHEYHVRIDPAKRSALEEKLRKMADSTVNNGGMFRDGRIIAADPLSDTVLVSIAQLIRWRNGEKDVYPIAITRYYTAEAVFVTNNQQQEWRPMAYLTFDEAVPFFLEEDWDKLTQL